jgi:hypothetical protein
LESQKVRKSIPSNVLTRVVGEAGLEPATFRM